MIYFSSCPTSFGLSAPAPEVAVEFSAGLSFIGVAAVSGVLIPPVLGASFTPSGFLVVVPQAGPTAPLLPCGLGRLRTLPPPPVKGNALFLFAIFTLPFFELIVF